MILATGSNGLLGVELQNHLSAHPVLWTTREDFDITDRDAVWKFFFEARPSIIFHMAAWTDVAGAETNKAACWNVNVNGTRNIVQAAKFIGARVVYISTDYVFDGELGRYNPLDAPNPVNYYALTKMVGEGLVSSSLSSLIIRTSFKPHTFNHPAACTDMWTSADYVDIIAPLVAKVAVLGYTGIYHVGTGRKSIFELAKRRTPLVKAITRESLGVSLPRDVSFGRVVHCE